MFRSLTLVPPLLALFVACAPSNPSSQSSAQAVTRKDEWEDVPGEPILTRGVRYLTAQHDDDIHITNLEAANASGVPMFQSGKASSWKMDKRNEGLLPDALLAKSRKDFEMGLYWWDVDGMLFGKTHTGVSFFLSKGGSVESTSRYLEESGWFIQSPVHPQPAAKLEASGMTSKSTRSSETKTTSGMRKVLHMYFRLDPDKVKSILQIKLVTDLKTRRLTYIGSIAVRLTPAYAEKRGHKAEVLTFDY